MKSHFNIKAMTEDARRYLNDFELTQNYRSLELCRLRIAQIFYEAQRSYKKQVEDGIINK